MALIFVHEAVDSLLIISVPRQHLVKKNHVGMQNSSDFPVAHLQGQSLLCCC